MTPSRSTLRQAAVEVDRQDRQQVEARELPRPADRVARRQGALEGAAGEVALQDGPAEERRSLRAPPPARRSAPARRRSRGARSPPFWRASTKRARHGHRARDLRRGRIGTSTSVTVGRLARGDRRPSAPARPASRRAQVRRPDHEQPVAAQQQLAGRSRRAPASPRTIGAPPVTSTIRSVPSVIANTSRPSVLTTSGSSTPSSWTFVPRSRARFRPASPLTGAAVGAIAPVESVAAVPAARRSRRRTRRQRLWRHADAAAGALRARAREGHEVLAAVERLQPRPARHSRPARRSDPGPASARRPDSA